MRRLAPASVVLLCVVLAVMACGVVLGIAGLFVVWLVLPAALAAVAGLVWLADLRRGPVSSAPGGWWAAAIGISGVATLVNVRFAAEHAVIDRDPGLYAQAAVWLARTHRLAMEPLDGPFAAAPTLEPRMHGLPALQAAASWVLGEVGLYRTPALLAGAALLMVFGLACELAPPSLALVATAALALSIPFVYTARDAFSEPLLLLFVAGGGWLLVTARRVGSSRRTALAGAALAGTACVRVDFVLYGVALAAFALWPAAQVRWRALLAGALPLVAVGVADAFLRARPYLDAQRATVERLLIVVGVAVVAVVVLARWSGPRTLVARHRRRVAGLAVVLLAAAGIWALVVMPVVRTARDPDLMVPFAWYFEPLQLQAGIAVPDAERSFFEYAGRWLVWYLGWPAALLALTGACLLVRRAVLGTARAAEVFVLAFALVSIAAVVVRPSILPDQPWAARRLVPFGFAGALLLTLPAIESAAAVARRWATFAAPAVGTLLSGAVLVPIALTTAPVADQQSYRGQQNVVDAVCGALPHGAAVLAVGPANLAGGLPLPLRASCGLRAEGVVSSVQDARPTISTFADEWAARGEPLYVAAPTVPEIQALPEAPVVDAHTDSAHTVVPTLLGAPRETARSPGNLYSEFEVYVAPASPAGSPH